MNHGAWLDVGLRLRLIRPTAATAATSNAIRSIRVSCAARRSGAGAAWGRGQPEGCGAGLRPDAGGTPALPGKARRRQVENRVTNGRFRFERMGRPGSGATGDDYRVAASPSAGAGTDTRSSRPNSSSALSHSPGTSRRTRRARVRQPDRASHSTCETRHRVHLYGQRIEMRAGPRPLVPRKATAPGRCQQRVGRLDRLQRGVEGPGGEQRLTQPIRRFGRLVPENPRHSDRAVEHERRQ